MSILADRYASREMRELWSREYKVVLERDLWISVLKSQKLLGLDVTEDCIQKYEAVKNIIDLASIDQRETKTQHDVKARIEEFNSLAGFQKIHIGMTSRDVTENVEILQSKEALDLVQIKSKNLLTNLANFAERYAEVPLVARTHNVPAQLTTLGRRVSTWIEEFMFSLQHLEELRKRLPLKGIKGAIGTSQDLHDYFGVDAALIERNLMTENNLHNLLFAPAQIYPRSIDYEIITTLVQLASAPSNIAMNVRLMSGLGILSEGIKEGQTGSSAMPHKVNARLSERVNGLSSILKGHAVMLQELVGNQWNEGDVSCSVVRRVALPEAFYAIDAILDNVIRIIRRLKVFPEVLDRETKENLPFLISSQIMNALVKKGVGREDAHSIVKKYSLVAAENFRKTGENNLIDLITNDSEIPLKHQDLDPLLNPSDLTSMAVKQTKGIIARALAEGIPSSKADLYRPSEAF
jgi:adenylosuccinate lyase